MLFPRELTQSETQLYSGFIYIKFVCLFACFLHKCKLLIWIAYKFFISENQRNNVIFCPFITRLTISEWIKWFSIWFRTELKNHRLSFYDQVWERSWWRRFLFYVPTFIREFPRRDRSFLFLSKVFHHHFRKWGHFQQSFHGRPRRSKLHFD